MINVHDESVHGLPKNIYGLIKAVRRIQNVAGDIGTQSTTLIEMEVIGCSYFILLWHIRRSFLPGFPLQSSSQFYKYNVRIIGLES